MSEAPKVIFDSAELAPCACGAETLLVEFLAGGGWIITCPDCWCRRWGTD